MTTRRRAFLPLYAVPSYYHHGFLLPVRLYLPYRTPLPLYGVPYPMQFYRSCGWFTGCHAVCESCKLLPSDTVLWLVRSVDDGAGEHATHYARAFLYYHAFPHFTWFFTHCTRLRFGHAALLPAFPLVRLPFFMVSGSEEKRKAGTLRSRPREPTFTWTAYAPRMRCAGISVWTCCYVRSYAGSLPLV